MSEMPMWWLVVSGLFFLANLLFFAVMCYIVLFKIMPIMQNLSPKVESISNRVDHIAQKVEELSTTTSTSMQALTGRAQSVATSVDTMLHSASRQFERFSPFLVGALTAIRLVKALGEIKAGRSARKATTREVLEEEKDGKALAKAETKHGRKTRA